MFTPSIYHKRPIFSTTKPNNKGHPTIETEQVWSLGWFQSGLIFLEKINSNWNKKIKLIYFKLENKKLVPIFFLKM